LQFVDDQSIYSFYEIPFLSIISQNSLFKSDKYKSFFQFYLFYAALTDEKEKFKKVSLKRLFGKKRPFAKNYAQ